MATDALFREVQRMTQVWVWLLTAFAAAGAWAVFILQVVMRIDPDAEPLSDLSAWIVWVAVGLLLPLLLYAVRLRVEVTRESLSIRYFPLVNKTLAPGDIRKAFARTYHPIREYGGWGVRWTPWGGRAYNMNGNRGVQLELAGGKKLLIGTQRPEELEQAIALMLSGAGS